MYADTLTAAATCHCGREATHMVSNGTVTIRSCYIHARKAAQSLRAQAAQQHQHLTAQAAK